MLLSKNILAKFFIIAASIFMLAACTFRPVYTEATGNNFAISYSSPKSAVELSFVEELKFRLGKSDTPQFALETNLSTSTRAIHGISSQFVRSENEATVRVSYVLTDISTGEVLKKGERSATAIYQSTSQNVANNEALDNAYKRAAKDVARQISLLVANTLNERQP
jgi:LPS-assembly lipoprotein